MTVSTSPSAGGNAVDEGGNAQIPPKPELVNLTIALVAINGWNRLSITFRVPAGAYQPPAKPNK